MPYSIDDQKNLPENVKKLKAKKRRQWIHIWNSVYSRTNDEGRAFAAANARAKELDLTQEEMLELAEKALLSHTPMHSYEHIKAQANQMLNQGGHKLPGYDHSVIGTYDDNMMVQSYGGSDTGDAIHAIPYTYDPDKDGDGLVLDYGKAKAQVVKLQPKPTPKAAASTKEDETSRGGGLVQLLGKFFGATKNDADDLCPLTLVRVKEGADLGRMRFFATYTNCYKDRQKEIIATAAHKEFVDWANANSVYPEMWLWHKQGTRWGEVDRLDFNDGLCVASGLVDPQSEPMAERLVAMGKSLGFSHGFVGLRTKEGIWTKIRTFEVTALPRSNAANPYTSPLEIYTAKEADLAFTEETRKFFTAAGVSDDTIKGLEAVNENLANNLKSAGIEYKEAPGDEPAAGEGTPSIAPLIAQGAAVQKAVGDLAASVKVLTDDLKEVKTIAEAANKSIDERVKEVLTPRAQPNAGYKASEAAANATESREVLEAQKSGNSGDDWLSGQIFHDMRTFTGAAPAVAGANEPVKAV